ncbi:MAG: nitrite/sulfite reductase [Candidatus Nitrosoabyssus spongiisocia]|nr:MAG: nitrite/sulfite reductase [Nitrosopumilaceae archaeon AB1(1)]
MNSVSIKKTNPTTNWARMEEADNFAHTVKLFRQGKYDAANFRRFRLQHGAYGTRMTDDYAMVRIKVPAGEAYPVQLRKIAELSEAYSIGSAHVSTRENLQLHWIVLEDVSEIMKGLAQVGLTSREACGNTVRNVMCSPLSGVCPNEEFDATPYAIATAKFMLRNTLNQNLPRKFKFNFTCCEKHGMIRMVDVGLVPVIMSDSDGKHRGFKIFLGGGLGNKSFVGHQLEEFTPEEDILYTSIAVIRIFDRLGNRKNMARNRMRYLVDDMGWEVFQNLVLKERAVVRATQSVITKLDIIDMKNSFDPMLVSSEQPDDIEFTRWKNTNTVKQKQNGFHTAFITLEAGDITATQLRLFADICEKYSAEGNVRVGFTQDMCIRWIHESQLSSMYKELMSAGLAKTGALTMASPIGCSGTTSCNLALTNSHRLAKEIQRKFLELKLDAEPLLKNASIKISGCPNSCGQHEIATVGFYGGGSKINHNMYAVYQMSLGGRFDEHTALGTSCMRIPAKRVISAILQIIEAFRAQRTDNQMFVDWIDSIVQESTPTNVTIRTVKDIKKMLEPLAVPPTKEEDEEFYADYGADTSYHTKTGKGECAA